MEDKKQKKMGLMQRFTALLKTNKKLEYAVYAGIALLVIALYVSSLPPAKQTSDVKTAIEPEKTGAALGDEVEEKLASVLSSIRGAGRVEVMITYDSGPELVTAMNTDTNVNRSETTGDGKTSSTEQQTESKKPATVSSSGSTIPIVLTEKQPAVRGVLVVAEGAGNLSVRLNLQRAVQTVLDVPIANIEIFERADMEGQ